MWGHLGVLVVDVVGTSSNSSNINIERGNIDVNKQQHLCDKGIARPGITSWATGATLYRWTYRIVCLGLSFCACVFCSTATSC